jgi:ribose transport system substrate-binding protein
MARKVSRRVLAALAAIFLIGAGAAHADTPYWLGGPLKKPLSQTRIGITVLYPGSNAYQARYAEEASSYSKQLGIQATVLDPQGDPAKQFDQMQDLISQHVDAIILWPTSETALIPAVRAAYHAGIPVITSNSELGAAGQRFVTAHTGPSDCILAQQAADTLGTAMHGKGNIVMVEGTPGYTVSRVRKTCFVDHLKAAYPGITIVGAQPANWNREQAQTVTEDLLTRFGKKIDGIYAFDDGMGAGVINALKAAGYKPGQVPVVTCNMFREGYTSIQEGWETGSNVQSPIDDARLAIQTAIKVVNGIPVPKKQTIAHEAVTKANVDSLQQPTW